MKAPSIRKRLLALVLLPAVLIQTAGTLSDYFTALTPYRDAYDQALFDAALAISAHVRADAQGQPNLSLPPDAIAILRYDSYDSIFFKVTTAMGAFIAGDRDLPELHDATSDAQQRFLESAAHQLRTPLTGLQIQLELLTEDPSAAPVRERVAMLLEATQRLTHTTQQLLALARSDEAGSLRWEFTQIELSQIVESTVADRISAAIGAGIDIGVETEPGSIQGVRWLLVEALSNLVNNAIAHTPPDGVITVRCGIATGAGFLEVSNSGIGIPVDEREQVLGRFFRGSNARGAGSGLGLAIVAEVAQLHGASVSIDSGPDGKGTSVRIVFPARAALS